MPHTGWGTANINIDAGAAISDDCVKGLTPLNVCSFGLKNLGFFPSLLNPGGMAMAAAQTGNL